MKKIDIPEPQLMHVQSEDGKTTKREVDFKTFVLSVWCNDQKFGSNLETLKLCNGIKGAVRVSNGHIELSERELAALKAVAENPSGSYLPADSEGILAFYNALTNAKDE